MFSLCGLQDQLEVLVGKFGLPQELKPACRHVWLSLLPHTSLLDILADE